MHGRQGRKAGRKGRSGKRAVNRVIAGALDFTHSGGGGGDGASECSIFQHLPLLLLLPSPPDSPLLHSITFPLFFARSPFHTHTQHRVAVSRE